MLLFEVFGVIMLIVFLTNRKDYEPFLADVVFGLTLACGCAGAHLRGRPPLEFKIL